jgi:ADP-L-glycero-D-manno-heptose 6-epimerase
MIVVTGVAGFIGSNIVRELNLLGEAEILVVDSLKSSPNPAHPKFLNLTSAKFGDFMDKREFRTEGISSPSRWNEWGPGGGL